MKKLALILAAVMALSCMMIVPTAATSGADVLASADMYLTFEGDSYADTKGNYSITAYNSDLEAVDAVFVADGKFGTSIETSDSSYLEVSDLVFGADSYTITAWTKIAAYNGSDPVLFGNKDWNSGGNPGMVFVYAGGKYRVVSTANGERVNHDVDVNSEDVEGQWVHIAIVVDRAAGAETFYINGVPTFEDVIFWEDDVMDSDYPFNIGEDGTGFYNGDNLTSQFDEFAFFKRALSMDEVHAIYTYAPEGYEAATAPEVNLPDYSAPLTYTADPAAVVAEAALHVTFDGELPADVKSYVGSSIAYYYRDEIATHPDAKDLTEEAPEYVEGIKGQAMKADIENTVNLPFDISEGTSYTISGWYKMNELDGEVYLFNFMQDGGQQHGTYITARQSDIFVRIGGWFDGYTSTDIEAPYLNSPITSRFGEWNHIALTVNRETKEVVVYFNGRAVVTTTYNEALDAKQAAFDGGYKDIVLNNDHRQGQMFYGSSSDVEYDEVALFKKALTADEVAALYSYVAAPADDTTDDEPTGDEPTGDDNTGDDVIDDNPTVDDEPTDDEPDAPQTFDIAIVAAVASIISLAGYAIAKKH